MKWNEVKWSEVKWIAVHHRNLEPYEITLQVDQMQTIWSFDQIINSDVWACRLVIWSFAQTTKWFDHLLICSNDQTDVVLLIICSPNQMDVVHLVWWANQMDGVHLICRFGHLIVWSNDQTIKPASFDWEFCSLIVCSPNQMRTKQRFDIWF